MDTDDMIDAAALEEKLEVCPFCGGSGQFYTSTSPYTGGEVWRVECLDCCACTDSFPDAELAAEKWNKRFTPGA